MRINPTVSSLLVLAIGGLLYSVVSSHSQGPLIPTQAPGPSMKTLDQVEARKPVQALSETAPYNITAPGSYYLTGNITVASGNAIVISSDDVSLDLNGFTIRSTYTVAVSPANPNGGSSGNAISIFDSRSRLTVRNGSIVSGTTVPDSGSAVKAGFSNGIYSDGTITQALVSEVHVTGVGSTGIYLDHMGVVDRCTVRNCTDGIRADEVQNCSVENCLTYGINAVGNANNCTAFGRDNSGLVCANATNCTGTSTRLTGLSCSGNATNCTGSSTSGMGLSCTGNATNCTGTSGDDTGLSCTGNATNCTGTSTGGTGLSCGLNATNCSGNAAVSTGLYCVHNATNCNGSSTSGTGLACFGNAANCSGASASGALGIYVVGTASFCRGSRSGGAGIIAGNAIGCTVSNGTVTAPLKFLGTP